MNRIETVRLGPDAFSMAYRVETRQDDWLMFHAHQGIELLYVHEGFGEASIERLRFPIRPGVLLFFQPYQLHKVDVPVSGRTPYVRTVITFEPRIVEPYLAPYPQLGQWFAKLWRGFLPQQFFDLGASDRIPRMLEDYHALYHDSRLDRQEERSLFLVTLLRELRHRVFPPEVLSAPISDPHSRHIDRMLDWIEGNFSRPFDLQAMARELHLSPYYLSHLFKEHTGMSISAYLASRRIREACNLLSATSEPVQTIARKVGGFSPSHFAQLFKKHKQMSPEAFRQAVRRSFQSGS